MGETELGTALPTQGRIHMTMDYARLTTLAYEHNKIARQN
jgi:hypothetical protein